MSFNLLIDFEATGVKPESARIMEVGALLVDENWQPIKNNTGFSKLVYQPETFPIPDEVKKVTGLNEQMLENDGIPLRSMFEELGRYVIDTIGPVVINYHTAYNAEYDKGVYEAEWERVYGQHIGWATPWICAMRDLEPNYAFKCWKMSHLALDHGIPVDPNGLHRAINDVQLMRSMLEKVAVPARAMFEFQQMPWVVLSAAIPKPWEDGGRGKDEAVKLGYAWEMPRGSSQKFEKLWVKQVKASQVDFEIKRAPFKVKQLTGGPHGS